MQIPGRALRLACGILWSPAQAQVGGSHSQRVLSQPETGQRGGVRSGMARWPGSGSAHTQRRAQSCPGSSAAAAPGSGYAQGLSLRFCLPFYLFIFIFY